MIDIQKLTPEDVGKWVVYRDPDLPNNPPPEIGKIKSWNDTWVFVVYKCNDEWNQFFNYTGCATDPKCLTFVD